MREALQDLFVCIWPVSWSILSSRSVPVVAGVRIPFLFRAGSYPLYDSILLIRSSVDGRWGGSTFVRNAAMNMGVWIALWSLLSSSAPAVRTKSHRPGG